MSKASIHKLFVDQLGEELESITQAARNSFETATNGEHQANNKYDTFSLESSYLARGQAKRAEDLSEALSRLRNFPIVALAPDAPIELGALVRLDAGAGDTRTLFFGPTGGGENVDLDNESITIVTATSPLVQAMIGKSVGDSFDIAMGIDVHTFTVTSVE
jgi:transcription elongation GreA/GreB family factor